MVERHSTEVLVVGAGPVGLMVTAELRLHGVDVMLVDQLPAPMRESRASQLNARTMEILDERGLVPLLGELQRETVGHYGGVPLDVGGTDSVHSGHWKVPQVRTEAALAARLAQVGLAVRRARRLDTLTVTDDGVRAELAGPAGIELVTAEYVVGCDGGDSTVRRHAGIDMVGAEPARQLLRADVAGISVADRRFERHERGLAVAVRRPDGITRIMTHEFGRHVGRPDFAAVVRAWRDITGEDISAGRPIWVDAFDDTGKQATAYRRGRVLLAGDAAHVQMPIGGQALNLGLQDAVNLGWKLAAQVRGKAAPGLLDTYHTERHAVGARTLASVEAQALLLLGGAEVDAMREVFAELVALPSVRDRLAATASGLDLRYPVGDGHSLLGRRLPAVGGALSRSRTAALRTGRGVLLDLSGDHDRGTRLRAAARPWADRLVVLSGRAELGADAVLARPDGHVVWADHGQDLATALHTWFGVSS